MPNLFKVGDKVKISKAQMEINMITHLWGLLYDKIYTVIEVNDSDILIDKDDYPVRFYARFFELASAKSVGFVIE